MKWYVHGARDVFKGAPESLEGTFIHLHYRIHGARFSLVIALCRLSDHVGK